LAVVSVAAVAALSCGGNATQAGGGGGGAAGGGQAGWEDTPCAVYDDPEWFANVGFGAGPRTQRGTVQAGALSNAQDMIRRKMEHAYKGAVVNYNNLIGNNQGTDADNHVEAGGKQIIDKMVKDANTVCGPKWLGPDDKGQLECVLAIKISKKELARNIAANVKDMVSKNEELRIRFNESKFFETMENDFKAFKEEEEGR